MIHMRGAGIGICMTPRRASARFSIAIYIVALCVLLAGSIAVAGTLDNVVVFDIQAQTLGKALLEFGAQAHVQISFAWNSSTAMLPTHRIKGPYTGKEALAELLEGTQLKYVAHRGTIVIMPRVAQGVAASAQLPNGDSASTGKTKTERYAAVMMQDGPPEESQGWSRKSLQEVVVTGSRLATASKYQAQEVQIYEGLQIAQSGQNSISDFLATLPSVGVTTPSFNLVNFATTVQLRGLPVGTTLVLLNGRRVEASGAALGEFFNLSNIPIAAVQKVEVDPNGASAIYGSDALSGVVNIVLKRDFNGVSANTRYGWAKDNRSIQTSVALGRQWSKGGLSVIGSYETTGGLINSDRLLSASNNYLADGGPNNNYPVCNPGNVFSRNGAALAGAPAGSSPAYATVTGPAQTGKPPFTQFAYGVLNECSLIAGTALLPKTQRGAVLLDGHVDITSAASVFTELMYTHLNTVAAYGNARLSGTALAQPFTVAASNPFNPFGAVVGVEERLSAVPIVDTISTNFFRSVVGIKGTLATRWQWEIAAWQGTDWDDALELHEVPNHAAIENALNSPDPATAINPFVTGPAGNQALLGSLFASETGTERGRDESGQAFIRGPVMMLPTGEIHAAIGVDYQRSSLYTNFNSGTGAANTISRFDRSRYAGFGEAEVPIIPGRGASRKNPVLSVTASARHDRYSDFGAANTEQFGLLLNPAEGLALRATYGTAFSAPTLQLLHEPQQTFTGAAFDPVTRAQTTFQVLSGGNPNLQASRGHSYSVGLVYDSRRIVGLSLSATQWKVVETQIAQSVSTNVLVANESLFPGRVMRNAAGQIVDVVDTVVNFGSIDAEGIDYQVLYRHDAPRGVLVFTLDATETYHYLQALVPGATPIEVVSRAEDDADWAPRWKSTVGAGWIGGHIEAHMDARYTGSYSDYDSTRKIGNLWLLDANLHFKVGNWIGKSRPGFSGVYFDAGATNLLNRAPQFSNFLGDFYGFDAAQASIVGRSFYVEIGSTW